MKPSFRFAATLCVSVFAIGFQAQKPDGEIISAGRKFVHHSNVLGEERTYWVSLPVAYDDPNFEPEHYPVIYVLDGKSAFFPLAGLVDFMSGRESVNFQIPECVVVGVDTSNRERDLIPDAAAPGGIAGNRFLAYLTRELIPIIEAQYRTLPFRIYVGHSLGGLTGTFTLLESAGVFDGYLAIDPSLWWNGGKLVKDSPQSLGRLGTKKIQRYYLSVVDGADDGGQNAHVKNIHQLGFSLAANAPENLKWKLDVIPGTDHSSIPLLSWYNGLLFVFQGYDLSHYGMMQNPDAIEPHFAELAKRTGLFMDPPQSIFWILAHYLTTPNRYPDAAKALKVIHMGLKYHPQSPYLHEKLGAANEIAKDPVRALESYQTALKLNPGNTALEEKIKKLKS